MIDTKDVKEKQNGERLHSRVLARGPAAFREIRARLVFSRENAASQRAVTHHADLVLLADGRLLPSIIVCIDDRQLSADQDIPLRDGNQVMLLSAISGG